MIRSQTNPHDAGKGLRVSFEFFPPKTDAMAARLWETVERLEPMAPDFVSVTYGAGGSTRERTQAIVKRMAEETMLRPAGHITCVAATKDEIDQVLRDYWAAGVKRIVALRGDPTDGIGTRYVPHPGGYAYASDLIAGARKIADFDISVGCYPEVHPDAPSLKAEVENLKRKFDAGATRAISQFFFYPDVFFKFVDAARAAGITQPIIPGIMLQSNFNGLKRMADLCGTAIPARIAEMYDGLEDDPETRDLVTAHVAAELCNRLAEQGVNHFHFYTMNRAGLSLSTCRLLGLKPQSAKAA
ncbi:methylenetetrahydrofolate reductase [NAD(P)H] [Hyphomonas sp.]|uniref:methylenetetrahydrofolate reductase [NAD(P)H] n=1 Tax=Hyphomonas sp. TaxID=87 RepID=UPI0025BB298D|nr:methylenetetrahydrofolate reductase [NAD(P)H] [Hyphomonas sp.]MBI1400284.1 methylenetetrahydrofolate reductase [NAD(P)H] [Hyphomonas sp.]